MQNYLRAQTIYLFEMRKEVENWLVQANDDLSNAEVLFNNVKYDGAVFFCQQAVEKALKAICIKKYGELFKVHDLVFLARKLSMPEELVIICDKLTRIYTQTRYPIDMIIPAKSFSAKSAKEFLEISERVLKWLKKM